MNAINPGGWKPELGGAQQDAPDATFTGNRALMLEEPLIFEIGSNERTGVDFEDLTPTHLRWGGGERSETGGPRATRASALADSAEARFASPPPTPSGPPPHLRWAGSFCPPPSSATPP